ncbi:MAG TPA: carbohydrate kinase [Thermomonas sp.]|nr:carbohydrate kinase [Thermomonas sp.]
MRPILCFGEALIDFLARPGDTPDAPRAFLQFAGGAPANVAVAIARLGGDARFIGMLGEDMFGDFLLDSLRDAGVGTDGIVRTSEAKTALAFVVLDPDGERSFSFYRPPAADLLFRDEHFQPAVFEQASAFHACSNSLTEPAIAEATYAGLRRARAAGALASVDLNLRQVLWAHDVDPTPWLWRLLDEAVLVKLARNELEYLAERLGSEEAVFERLFSAQARLVLVTDGAADMHWHAREGQGTVPGFRVRAIDTTAAGDAFVGGLLFRLAEQGVDAAGFDGFIADSAAIHDAMRFGAACGALAVTRHGAFAAMPSHADAIRLLQDEDTHGTA